MSDITVIADFWKAASATIAVFAFGFAVYRWLQEEKNKKRLSWQQITVFRIIQDRKKCGLDDIRADYLGYALQVKEIDLSKDDIQDDVLMMVIMGLIEKKLVVVWQGGEVQKDKYAVNNSSLDNRWKELEIQHLMALKSHRELSGLLEDIIKDSSGKLTTLELYHNRVEKERPDISFRDVQFVIRGMVVDKIVWEDDNGKLHIHLEGLFPDARLGTGNYVPKTEFSEGTKARVKSEFKH